MRARTVISRQAEVCHECFATIPAWIPHRRVFERVVCRDCAGWDDDGRRDLRVRRDAGLRARHARKLNRTPQPERTTPDD